MPNGLLPLRALAKAVLPRRVRDDFYRLYEHTFLGRKLAQTSKRLDLCAAEIANYFFLCGVSDRYPLRDKICLELGSGWVASHSLVFYLLGASKVYATDVERLLDPRNIATAVRSAVDYIVRDSLAHFQDYEDLRLRLDRLRAVDRFSWRQLEQLGIEYIAPVDLAEKRLGIQADFVFSKSVLEHVPIRHLRRFLANVTNDMAEDGMMFHLVHLEDHRDSTNDPFRFLGESERDYSDDMQTKWGNRLRRSQWRQILGELEALECTFAFEWSRKSKRLPERIDPSIQYVDDDDLKVTHLGVFGRKRRVGGAS